MLQNFQDIDERLYIIKHKNTFFHIRHRVDTLPIMHWYGKEIIGTHLLSYIWQIKLLIYTIALAPVSPEWGMLV